MKKIMMVVAVLTCTLAVAADDGAGKREKETSVWLPLGLSILMPPIQLPSPSHTVVGGMINLGYGQVENIVLADIGIINNVTDTMTGVEVGTANIADTCFGAQIGVVNIASKTAGVQVGALNFTGDLHGVQLGVLNFSSNGGAIVFPIFNLGF